MTRILVLGDTHCRLWEQVHPEIRRLVSEVDVVVHCGDFTGLGVVEGLRRNARRAVLVCGNSDPAEVRRDLPVQEVVDVQGRRIGVTHPHWGGPPFELELLLDDFTPPLDAVLFGHLHETVNELRDGVLFLNPGQAYRSFLTDATVALLTVSDGLLSAEIQVIEPWRDRYPAGT